MSKTEPGQLPPEVERDLARVHALPPDQRSMAVEALCAKHPTQETQLLAWLEDMQRADDAVRAAAPATQREPDAAITADHPEQIGPYKILDFLGEGGMGTVYLAEQKVPIRRRVALKVIKRGMDTDQVLRRFEAERQALAMMDHAHIARVLDAGASSEGRAYFAMEYVKGIPLNRYCDQNKLGLEQRLALFLEVCAGVQHAHHKGVIHRDLTPANVLVSIEDDHPTAKIIDFGLARATDHRLVEGTIYTQQGVILGTPQYMSPEQAGLQNLDVDTRTDVYSLGVLLYELVSGLLPLDAGANDLRNPLELQRRIRDEQPLKPSTKLTSHFDQSAEAARQIAASRSTEIRALARTLRGDLDWISLKALEKDRTRRYASPDALASDVRRFLRNEPVEAGPPALGYRARKFLRRYRVQTTAALVVFVGLAVALGVALVALDGEREARAAAETSRIEADEARAATEAASRRLERALQLATVADLDSASEEADALLPPWPDNTDGLRAWLSRWTAFVANRKEAIQSTLGDLERPGEASFQRDDATPDRHARLEATAFLRAQLLRVRGRLGQFSEPGGLIDQIRARLEWSEAIHERSIVEYRPAWRDAIEAVRTADGVRASELYRGLVLQEQVGLAPLGMDPDSKLWEFAHLRTGRPPHRLASSLEIEPDTGVVFVLLPAASQVPLGADAQNPGSVHYDPDARPNEGPVRTTDVEAFFLSKYELTQAQWEELTGENPSKYAPGELPVSPRHPVEQVSWTEATAVLHTWGLDLPSEDEWEYACRAGSRTPWPFGPNRDALLGEWGGLVNISDASAVRARAPSAELAILFPDYDDGFPIHAPVGCAAFPANAFGLHEMNGNVWEWCRDAYGTGYAVRGGSYYDTAEKTRSTTRRGIPATAQYDNVGVRPARRLINNP